MTTLLAMRSRSEGSGKLTNATELSSTSRFHCSVWAGRIFRIEDSILTSWLSLGRNSSRCD
jgi:hypothetical protein